ncbi:MAG: hypothetical protein ACKVKO_04575 [Acidimicrobiales bacterium]|jgi:hypothetical protein|tara:strand:- start:215 stop:457 length:243 start_codon:yes stop_codon:yes gene_type:complete
MAPFGDDLPEQQPDYAFWQTAIEMGNLGSGRDRLLVLSQILIVPEPMGNAFNQKHEWSQEQAQLIDLMRCFTTKLKQQGK